MEILLFRIAGADAKDEREVAPALPDQMDLKSGDGTSYACVTPGSLSKRP